MGMQMLRLCTQKTEEILMKAKVLYVGLITDIFYFSVQNKIKVVFDNLIQLDHPNIVKFHKYWTDTKSDKEKPRVSHLVFIIRFEAHIVVRPKVIAFCLFSDIPLTLSLIIITFFHDGRSNPKSAMPIPDPRNMRSFPIQCRFRCKNLLLKTNVNFLFFIVKSCNRDKQRHQPDKTLF